MKLDTDEWELITCKDTMCLMCGAFVDKSWMTSMEYPCPYCDFSFTKETSCDSEH
jgi:hypothetical protein